MTTDETSGCIPDIPAAALMVQLQDHLCVFLRPGHNFALERLCSSVKWCLSLPNGNMISYRECSHVVIPGLNAAGGTTSRPEASTALLMSNVAMMSAAASQITRSANACPGQLLYAAVRYQHQNNRAHEFEFLYEPAPKTKYKVARKLVRRLAACPGLLFRPWRGRA